MFPEWLSTPQRVPLPLQGSGSRKGMRPGRYLDKTLQRIGRLGREAAFMMETGNRRGLLQALDPRARVLSFLFLIIAASITQRPLSLITLCLLGPVLAVLSRIPAGRYLRQVWLTVPLFTATIALPAALNIITPGTMILPIISLSGPVSLGPLHLPETIGVTREGLAAAFTLVLRTGASVSLALLVMLATPWHDLLKALQSLGVPKVFLMILSVAWRYLFVLIVAIEEMCMARKSRGIDERRLSSLPSSGAHGRSWAASRIGALFRKTQVLGDEVNNAMTSRGFRGEARNLSRFRLQWFDIVWCAGALFLAGLAAFGVV